MLSTRVNYVVVGAFLLLVAAGIVVSGAILAGRTGATDRYYTSFDDVTGLKYGSRVLYMGHRVGQVVAITPRPAGEGEGGGARRSPIVFDVAMDVDRALSGWRVPDDSVAQARAGGLLAAIDIDIRAGSSRTYLEPGDRIEGLPQRDLFGAVSDTANAVKRLTEETLAPLLVTLNRAVQALGVVVENEAAPALERISRLTTSLSATAPAALERIGASADDVRRTSERVRALLDEGTEQRIDVTLENLERASSNIAALSVEAREDLDRVLGEESAARIRAVLENVSAASGNVASLTGSLDRRIGTVLNERTAADLQRALADMAAAARNVAKLTGDLGATRARLDGVIDEAGGAISENRPDLRRSVGDLRDTLRVLSDHVSGIATNLDGASRNLYDFSRQIRQNPGVLLRGAGAPERRR